MFLLRSIAAFPLIWQCATAIPAGPGWWPNGTSSDVVEDDFSVAAYGLIDTYDGTNWLDKFYVEAVSSCIKWSNDANISRSLILHVCSRQR